MNIHDIYRPILKHFRTKRMEQFAYFFHLTRNTQVIDVGGNHFNWKLIPIIPKLTIANIYTPVVSDDQEITWLVADGCQLPFSDDTFEIAYSNSVIEHLSNWSNQQSFAKEIRRISQHYYVQTPNRHFFIEPHLLTPFIHFIPSAIRLHLLRNFTVWGLIGRPSKKQCQEFMEEIRLLDEEEMKQLFPDAEIIKEKVWGFTKSLIAIKN